MIHLIIAGEFYDDIKKYEELILKLKLKNNITIENKFIKTENIYKWFSAADFIMQTNTSAKIEFKDNILIQLLMKLIQC